MKLVLCLNQRIAGLEPQTMTTSVGVSYSTGLKDKMWEQSVLLLFTSGVRCAKPFLDAASLITTVPLRTGENTGWFAGWGHVPRILDGTGSRIRVSLVEKGHRRPVSYRGGPYEIGIAGQKAESHPRTCC